jgi:hypothetical protein
MLETSSACNEMKNTISSLFDLTISFCDSDNHVVAFSESDKIKLQELKINGILSINYFISNANELLQIGLYVKVCDKIESYTKNIITHFFNNKFNSPVFLIENYFSNKVNKYYECIEKILQNARPERELNVNEKGIIKKMQDVVRARHYYVHNEENIKNKQKSDSINKFDGKIPMSSDRLKEMKNDMLEYVELIDKLFYVREAIEPLIK